MSKWIKLTTSSGKHFIVRKKFISSVAINYHNSNITEIRCKESKVFACVETVDEVYKKLLM